MNSEERLLFHLAKHTSQLKELADLLEQADTDNELITGLTHGLNALIATNDEVMAEVLNDDDDLQDILDFAIE